MATPGRRLQQASPYTASNSAQHSSDIEIFRSLVFDGYVSLCISLASNELPQGSDRSIDALYLRAPRIGYLPLLIQEIRRHLLELVLDDHGLATLKEDQLWFEHDGEPLKWHWPIGLICDCINASSSPASSPSISRTDSSATTDFSRSLVPAPQPIRITLHLSNPPVDRLLLSPSINSCRTNFMNQLKEADVVRWGSVKRVTALRKLDQDALWDGVIAHDFDTYWSVASKLVPSPRNGKILGPRPSATGTASTLDTLRLPDANSQRSIPIRAHIGLNGPVIQDVLPATIPGTSDPHSLQTALLALVPALVPAALENTSSSFVAAQKSLVKRVLVHGIELPLDAELPWCSACLCYPDGWLSVVLGC